jgi:NAD(P)-dependent dehydrogenase (short-subunit alcohol dehydrogenase family)
MNDGLAALEGLTTKEVTELSAGNLIDIPGIEPEDVAGAVVFLVSEKARFMIGSQFVPDAGLLSR